MYTLRIGGKERDIRVKYKDAVKILRCYNQVYRNAKTAFQVKTKRVPTPGDSLFIPNIFFFWAVWKLLVKLGCWPLRKPFRSLAHMISEIEQDEVMGILTFLGDTILHTDVTDREDRDQGNRSGESTSH